MNSPVPGPDGELACIVQIAEGIETAAELKERQLCEAGASRPDQGTLGSP